ncbi:hypothetical protein C1M55_28220 [Rhodococcus qingshengii]|uniref:cutinase family protein n=1 Tax=Rhodococcus qingshengii TaxID=334542 RepID=UPI000C9FF96F|nr:cutinase family protein [Rhodococcus qingshengii]AUS34618.1 hypothetical protein C1M55_28220 [Rhodococcus qingshengii]
MRIIGTLVVVAACAIIPIAAATNASARNVIVVDGTGNSGAIYHAPDIHPGDTVTYVTYPATVLWPSYDESVQAGEQALRADLAAAPPDSLVIGYSQGARIVGDVLTEPQQSGVTGVVYADPRQAGSGVETQIELPGVLGATMSGERAPFTVPVESHCIPGDGVCDWHAGDPVGSIVGYLELHTRYFN